MREKLALQTIDSNEINEVAGLIPADWQDPVALSAAEKRLLTKMALVRLALTSVQQTLRQMGENHAR